MAYQCFMCHYQGLITSSVRYRSCPDLLWQTQPQKDATSIRLGF
ncbi:hypothetical protein [Flavobacterium sp. CF136]|nr:hypothetical protein [Flavobacterium sp. CF136]